MSAFTVSQHCREVVWISVPVCGTKLEGTFNIGALSATGTHAPWNRGDSWSPQTAVMVVRLPSTASHPVDDRADPKYHRNGLPGSG